VPYRDEPRPVFDARMMIHGSLSAILVGLGVILLLPGDTFATPVWRLFAEIGTENTWGGLFIAVGGAGGLGIDTPRHWVKVSTLLVLATVHGALAGLFLRGNPYGGASWTYTVIAAQGYYLAWRQVQQA
jgi:hypothetical protein